MVPSAQPSINLRRSPAGSLQVGRLPNRARNPHLARLVNLAHSRLQDRQYNQQDSRLPNRARNPHLARLVNPPLSLRLYRVVSQPCSQPCSRHLSLVVNRLVNRVTIQPLFQAHNRALARQECPRASLRISQRVSRVRNRRAYRQISQLEGPQQSRVCSLLARLL